MPNPDRSIHPSRARLAFYAAAALPLALANAADADTLTVCPSGCDNTTLQAAIDSANPGDTIQLATNTPHTEAETSVDKDLVIEGLGETQTIVQGAATPFTAAGRVFTVEAGNDVTFRDLTIRFGNAIGGPGGGIWIRPEATPPSVVRVERVTLEENAGTEGGGIANGGDLTLVDVLFTGNRASQNGGGLRCNRITTAEQSVELVDNGADGNGGAIYKGETDGAMRLHGVLLDGNRAESSGGGIFNRGDLTLDESSILQGNEAGWGGGFFQDGVGRAQIQSSQINSNFALDTAPVFAQRGAGVHVRGDLDIRDSEIRFNQTTMNGNGEGGGIYLGPGSDLTLERVAVRNNLADAGGGLYAIGGSSGRYTIEHSAFRQNSATESGGGIFHFQGDGDITNVTIAQNAADGAGGGLFARAGEVVLANVTIAGNLADVDGDGDGGGGVSFCTNCTPTVRLTSSIVAGNAVNGASGSPDCDVLFASGSFSLIGDRGAAAGFDCNIDGITAGMLFDVSPEFGPTSGEDFAIVEPLLPTSPAIDAGTCFRASGGSISADQRGAGAPVDGNGDTISECDMGAYEYLPEPGLGVGVAMGMVGLLARTRRRQ